MLDEDEGGKINGTNINESTVALIIIKKYNRNSRNTHPEPESQVECDSFNMM